MITVRNIEWLAGLLEGEGCFGFQSHRKWNPRIDLAMTDEDVVARASSLMKDGKYWTRYSHVGHKTQYCLRITGPRAIQWMMTLYLLMGHRRRGKIKEIITRWKQIPDRAERARQGWVTRRAHTCG